MEVINQVKHIIPVERSWIKP